MGVEKIEENDDQIEESDDMDMFDDDDDDDYDDIGPKRDHALPIKKRGRPKKILTDAEIEEATRAALGNVGTIPVIEITPVPRPAGAGAGEKKDAGETKTSGETPSTNDAKDSEAFRPFFVNESLEEEQDKGEESITGDRNPLDDDPLNSEVVTNPLGMEQYPPEDSNSKGAEAASEAVESVVTAGVNVLSAQLNEDEALLATVTCDEPTPAEVGDNPLGDADKLPEVSLPNGRPPSEGLVTRSDDTEQAEMTEEDLLTGPAHNLDDSQYKADYADPNLDDIFK